MTNYPPVQSSRAQRINRVKLELQSKRKLGMGRIREITGVTQNHTAYEIAQAVFWEDPEKYDIIQPDKGRYDTAPYFLILTSAKSNPTNAE